MTTATWDAPHIGPAHHPRRTAWIVAGALALAAVMAAAGFYWRHQNAVASDRLAAFQAAYARRCDASEHSPEQAALAKKLYLRSSTLRKAVERELTLLEFGEPCEEVRRALRAVD